MSLYSWCSTFLCLRRVTPLLLTTCWWVLASLSAHAEPSWDSLLELSPAAEQTSTSSATTSAALSTPDLPFAVSASCAENSVHFTLRLAPGSYIYRDSIVLTTQSGSLIMAQPKLPQASTHQDSMGTNQVYFDQLDFEVPILSAHEGDELILSYQGCDDQGICYPPQNFSVKLPHAIESSYTTLDQHTHDTIPTAPSEDGGFWRLLLNPSDGGAISDFISQNLAFGLILCFLLGIGLDLTPCVLPMLPIFSAMLVAKPTEGKVPLSAVLRQNAAYALGLSLSYMVLGLIFAALGASFHGVLQHPAVTCTIAVLLLICAAACAGLIELKVPSFITGPLQRRISTVNTKSFGGAFALGVVSAIVASPCTSAPLAGALIYVMQSGNTLLGAAVFLVIGLGMATPLLVIGIFGGRFLRHGGMVGEMLKRLLALLLLFAAYFITRHLMGQAEPFICSLLVFIASIYLIGSIIYFIIKHRLTLPLICAVTLVSLVPTYYAYSTVFDQVKPEAQPLYTGFTKVTSLNELTALTRGQPSFITFTAAWCTNCRYMAHHVYNEPDFLKLSSEFKRIVVDITDTNDAKTKELISHFNVMGVPYIVTLDDKGQIHSSHIGIADQDMVRAIVLDLKHKIN